MTDQTEKRNIDFILADLRKSDHKAYSQAIVDLKKIRDHKELNAVLAKVMSDKDEILLPHYLNLLDTILQENNENHTGHALSHLFHIAVKFPSKTWSEKAHKLITQYIDNENFEKYIRVMALRKCWRLITLQHRTLFTKIVGARKFKEVYSLVYENFLSRDKDLIELTLNVVRISSDSRANRFIRHFLKKSRTPEIILASLEAIQVTGIKKDGKLVKKFITSSDPEIKSTAIRALAKLWEEDSLPHIEPALNSKNTTRNTKREAINAIGSINHHRSAELLAQFVLNESDVDLIQRAEWAFHDFSIRTKIRPILEVFEKASPKTQLIFLNCLTNEKETRLVDLYFSILKKNPHIFTKIYAAIALSQYKGVNIQKTLKEHSFHQDQASLSYFAAKGYLSHAKGLETEFLEDLIKTFSSHDSPFHYLVVDELLKRKDAQPLQYESFKSYYFNLIDSDEKALQLYAIESSFTFSDKIVISRSLEKLDEDSHLFDKIKPSLLIQIAYNPTLLDQLSSEKRKIIIQDDTFGQKVSSSLLLKLIEEKEVDIANLSQCDQSRLEEMVEVLMAVNINEPMKLESIVNFAYVKNILLDYKFLDSVKEKVLDSLSMKGREQFLHLFLPHNEVKSHQFLIKEAFNMENKSQFLGKLIEELR